MATVPDPNAGKEKDPDAWDRKDANYHKGYKQGKTHKQVADKLDKDDRK